MNDLEKYFKQNEGRLIHKWHHYFEIYDRHFRAFRDKEINVLEIGVSHGGSLQMWRDYFGPKAKIFGVDINPECKNFEEENVEIFIGSQSDRGFLREIRRDLPPIDILIDDGGHTMDQQIVTFEELYDHVKSNGIYLCEDTHTSYRQRFGGGHKRRGTFIEYTKNLVDQVNAFHSEESSLGVDLFARSTYSMHYYDSVVVFEKGNIEKPTDLQIGSSSLESGLVENAPTTDLLERIWWRLAHRADSVLRILKLPAQKEYVNYLQTRGVFPKESLFVRAYRVLKDEGFIGLLKKAKNKIR